MFTSMSNNFNLHNQWILVLIMTNHLQSSIEVEDCPLLSDTGQYCIKNDDGIVPTNLDNDMWITFNRSVAKMSFSFSDLKPGILPIRQIHIGEPSGPILAVYSQNTKWRVGVENKNMQKDDNSKNKVSDAFVLIQSTLCMDCCFIMAVNFTQFSRSDNINESWNGMLYSLSNDLFVSSDENKPASILNMVWQMGSEPGGDCLDSTPLQIRGRKQEKASTTGKGCNPRLCCYCPHAPRDYRTSLNSKACHICLVTMEQATTRKHCQAKLIM